ncbi:jerky protein homolog-like [Sitodiplosis mosellana]|uniref:jerky protein homolog-like n=1 Tax=Sitodiplosis mosellana TaxID=263140 RepID=UPI002443C9D5|nr:jerky protein homolog-like [Sitodiplosis mosellana]
MSDRKRKKVTLSLSQKAEIIEKLGNGVMAKRIAEDYGVSESAISYIKGQKSQILEAVSSTVHEIKKKSLHKPDHVEMEEKLYKWFEFQRSKHCPISAHIIKVKAKAIFEEMYPDKDDSAFVASNGWFEGFKKRHGIRFLTVAGEKLSADLTSITPFIHRLHAKILEMNITEDQLYNADESGIYYRMLPKRTYVCASETSAPGRKTAKERLTFMLTANSGGSHKVKPLIIGKSKNPRCFKGFINPLPYANSKSAWMTRDIFRAWFFNHFVKEVREFARENNLPPKAILLIDNCPAHEELQTDDGNIITIALPPNVTSVLQPMDQSPINVFKMNYRKLLLSSVVANENTNIIQALKEHNIRDAIVMMKDVWANFSNTLLQNSWSKINNWDKDDYTEEDLVPLSSLRAPTVDYENVLGEVQTLLNSIAPDSEIATNEIEEWNNDTTENVELDDVDSSDSEGEAAAVVKIPHSDAIDHVNKLIEWCAQNESVGIKHTFSLLSLRSDIVTAHTTKATKQKQLTDYFK